MQQRRLVQDMMTKQFAISLHFYSPKAYKFVRKSYTYQAHLP